MVYDVAIVGLGGMGNAWKRWIDKHPDFELKYIVDTNTELLENVEMNKNKDNACDVPAYIDENVSTKVIKLIQSYTGIINKMVWRK